MTILSGNPLNEAAANIYEAVVARAEALAALMDPETGDLRAGVTWERYDEARANENESVVEAAVELTAILQGMTAEHAANA